MSSTRSVSSVRRPRGIVLLNGTPVSFLSFEVEKRSHFTVDVWTVDLSCWDQPENFGMTYWSEATGAIVEIKMGTLLDAQQVSDRPSSTTSLIIGQVDDIDIDPVKGTIELHGRSLAAKFIDTKTTNKWVDKTASEIATFLAEGQGLTPKVTATKIPIGHYYDDESAQLDRSMPEWELLTFLAQREGFECYVIGTTLYFGPILPDPNPYSVWVKRVDNVIWSNAIRLRLKRSLTLSQDITVSVISYDYWTGEPIKATANRRSRGLGGTQRITPQTRQAYIIRRAGITRDAAQQLASSTLDDLTKFERTIEVEVEGDSTMTVQRRIQLTETGSGFDQLYFVDRAVHKFSWAEGYEMTIHGKNIAPTSTELLVQGTPAEILPP